METLSLPPGLGSAQRSGGSLPTISAGECEHPAAEAALLVLRLTDESRSFIGQVPLTAIGFINIWYVLDLPDKGCSRLGENLRRVDFAGALILVSAVSSLLIGLHEGANAGWQTPRALGWLCACLPLSALFLLVELEWTPEPFVPRTIIGNRTVLACSLSNFFAFGTWLAITYYLPLYWQAVEQLSAGEASIRLLPGIVAHVMGSLFAGAVSLR